MQDERIRILQMVQEGKVTVGEGAQLLEALEGRKASTGLRGKARFIRVTVTESGREKVRVNIPVQLARVAMKFIPKDKLSIHGDSVDLDIDEILAAIESGAEGKIVDVDTGNDKIEVTVG